MLKRENFYLILVEITDEYQVYDDVFNFYCFLHIICILLFDTFVLSI